MNDSRRILVFKNINQVIFQSRELRMSDLRFNIRRQFESLPLAARFNLSVSTCQTFVLELERHRRYQMLYFATKLATS